MLTPDVCTATAQDVSCSVCWDCSLFSFVRDRGVSYTTRELVGGRLELDMCLRSIFSGRVLQSALLSFVGPYDSQLPEILPARLHKTG